MNDTQQELLRIAAEYRYRADHPATEKSVAAYESMMALALDSRSFGESNGMDRDNETSSNVRTRSEALKDLNRWRNYHGFSPIEAIVDDPEVGALLINTPRTSEMSLEEIQAIRDRDEREYQAEKLKEHEPTHKSLLERLRKFEDRAVYHVWLLSLFFSLALECANVVVWGYMLNDILPTTAAWLGLFSWLGAILIALAFVVWSTLASYIWPDAFKWFT